MLSGNLFDQHLKFNRLSEKQTDDMYIVNK